jgi:hypothetical protein
MDDAPTPQRAASAEERDRLREALARVIDPVVWEWRDYLTWCGREQRGASRYHQCYAEAYRLGCRSEEDFEGYCQGRGPKGDEIYGAYVCRYLRSIELADALLAGPLAPLLDRITAAEARAEEAEKTLVLEGIEWLRTKDIDRLQAAEADLVALARMYGEACRDLMGEAEGHRMFARAYGDTCEALLAATADRDRLADEVADLKKESAFLLDRLHDFENGSVTDDTARDWYGHVRPSMARLTALTATGGTTDGQA